MGESSYDDVVEDLSFCLNQGKVMSYPDSEVTISFCVNLGAVPFLHHDPVEVFVFSFYHVTDAVRFYFSITSTISSDFLGVRFRTE